MKKIVVYCGFPYAEKFLQKHECILECSMGQPLIDLFKDQYRGMTFTAPPEARMKDPCASYRIGLFFGGNQDFQPFDFRQVGLHKTAGHILGVDPEEVPPRLPANPPGKSPSLMSALQSSRPTSPRCGITAMAGRR